MPKVKIKQIIKMLFLSFLILNIFIITKCNANTDEELIKDAKPAEFSQDFLNWLKLSDKQKKKTIMPVIYEMPEEKESTSGYNTMFSRFYEIFAKSVESTYSLKDEIELRVKNQGNTSECWAFTFTNIIESTISKATGKFSDEYSPRHIDYSCTRDFLNNKINDYVFYR